MQSAAHIVGDYKIQSLLGKSDTSAVYLAKHQKSGEEVAIRFFIPAGPLDEALLRRSALSAKNLAGLKHPGLVEVQDAGTFRGVPYLISPFIPGQTLQQKLKKPMTPAQAARLLTPVARALVYLHAHHLPHRKVHSGNILMTNGFQLADLGVQQLADMVCSGLANRSGRAQQDLGAHPVRALDVRALIEVFVGMVSGSFEYEGGGWTKARLDAAVRQLEGAQPDLSQDVKNLVQGVLPDQQPFENMQALAQALEAVGGGESAPQKPEPARTQANPRAGRDRHAVKDRRNRPQKKRGGLWLVPAVLVVLALLAAGALLLNNLGKPGPLSVAAPVDTAVSEAAVLQPAEPTQQPDEESQPAVQESAAAPVSAPPEPTEEPEPEPPGIGSMMVSPLDAMPMVYVPAGEFLMGSNDRDADEKPQHSVYLDAYWIDRTEVTNSMYARCVQAGECKPPATKVSSKRTDYYNSPDYADYPVIFVSWQQAKSYCRWAGRRLPTEAEWEKAARGPNGFISPWGDNSPSSQQLNYNGETGDTSRVGSYPAGASLYGALDMSGNVWEWVSDWYSSRAYEAASYENPVGPEDGTRKVLRGGSWYYGINDIRAARRFSASDNTTINDIGFRCAQPAE